MESVRFFTGFPALAELQAFLSAKKDTPLQTSELYSSEANDKIVDLELRKSRFRVFQDREIFDLVNQTVQWLNESSSEQEFSFQLRCDNITETRYEKGGHFLKHKDFLSVTSNLVEEFTLILCVTPPSHEAVEGGETLIYPYASKDGVPFDTATPGNGLLFRKDLEHAGNLLKAGEKHILTANLWASRKQISDQVLFVTFPSADDDVAFHSAEARLQQVANQDTSYALPVDYLKGTMLDAHVRFVNQGYEQEGQDSPTVVSYTCSDFSFEEFGTVAKILQRAYVHEDEIRSRADCIEFFGPFRAENLLVNFALERKASADPEASCQRFVKPTSIKDGDKKLPAKKFKTNEQDVPEEANADMDVIICENESRTKVVCEVARQLGLESYVPFKMVFVEGQLLTGYRNNCKEVSVTPVALVLGDYNHVFAIQKCGGSLGVDECTLKEYHTERNYFDNRVGYGIFALDETQDDEDDEEDEDEDEEDYYAQLQQQREFYSEGGRGLGLKVAFGDYDVRDNLTCYIFEGQENPTFDPRDFHLLAELEPDDGAEIEGEVALTTSLFHRNDSGKVTFTSREADAASNYIASMELDERVKACKFTPHTHTL